MYESEQQSVCSVGQKPTLILLKYIQGIDRTTTLYCSNVHRSQGRTRALVSWAVPQAAPWNVIRLESWKRLPESQTSWPHLSTRAGHDIDTTEGKAGKATGLVEWGPLLCYLHSLFGGNSVLASSPAVFRMVSAAKVAVASQKVSSAPSPLSFNPEVRSPGPAKFTGRGPHGLVPHTSGWDRRPNSVSPGPRLTSCFSRSSL